MKYVERVSLEEIFSKYDNIIAWGVGPLFQMNYRNYYYKLDFIIDGTGEKNGFYYKDIIIKDEKCLKDLRGKSLIIIYTIYEQQIMEQISKYHTKDIDTIVYSLLDIKLKNGNYVTEMNAKSCEDMLVLMLTKQLNIETVQFLEIGVCHPIMRNNTYLLYEQFSGLEGYRGVLVEANPLCWDLIEEYRGRDSLIKKGICREGKTKMPFYIFPNLLGHSTFAENIAAEKIKEGQEYKKIEVEVDSINNIIANNFESVPDILALDAEGLDYDILYEWDHKKYPFKIVISEVMEESKGLIETLMDAKGYSMYAKTVENIVWLRKDQVLHI